MNAISGDGILIEITPQPYVAPGADMDSNQDGVAGDKVEALTDRLGEVGDKIGVICTTLQSRAMAAVEGMQPDEFEIEFGIKLAGEAGIPLVSKGSAECNFVIKAKWDLRTPPAIPNGQ